METKIEKEIQGERVKRPDVYTQTHLRARTKDTVTEETSMETFLYYTEVQRKQGAWILPSSCL